MDSPTVKDYVRKLREYANEIERNNAALTSWEETINGEEGAESKATVEFEFDFYFVENNNQNQNKPQEISRPKLTRMINTLADSDGVVERGELVTFALNKGHSERAVEERLANMRKSGYIYYPNEGELVLT